MTITTKPENTPIAPVTKTTVAESGAVIPVTKTTVAEGAASIPVTKTTVSEASGAIPVSKTTVAEASSVIPTTKTTVSAAGAVIPTSKTTIPAAGVPRALVPLVGMNFTSNQYMQGGNPVLFDGLFTYSRNSSATFWNRRLDRNGKWEYFLDTDFVGTVTNLLTYSEQMTHADWVLSGTITAVESNLITPEGSKAYLIDDADAAADNGKIQQTIAVADDNATRCMSVYLKKGNRSIVGVSCFYTDGSNVSRNVTINLDSGTIISGADSWTTYMGGGWWRVSTIITNNTSGNVSLVARVYPATNVISEIGTVYMSRVQFVDGVKPLPYVKTISVSDSDTFTENLRLEYDPITGEALGGKDEGGSTNLFLRSEEFDNASWIKTDASITANAGLAPDETTSTDKLEAGSTATIAPVIKQSIISVAAQQHTSSFYVKKSEASFTQIAYGNTHVANNPRVNFDLTNGTIGSQDADIDNATIEDVGNNTFRVSSTVTAVGTSLQTFNSLIKSATDTRSQTNSWTAGDGAHIWGAQCEKLPFASSYIRTEGGAVTRVIDILNIPSAGNQNPNHYTWEAVYEFTNNEGVSQWIMSNTASNSSYGVQVSHATGDNTRFYNGGVSVNNGVPVDGQFYKNHFTFDGSTGEQKIYIDGVLNATNTSGIIAEDVTLIGIGVNTGLTSGLFGHIKKLNIYEEIMTAQEVSLR